jgi:hypothetical protein
MAFFSGARHAFKFWNDSLELLIGLIALGSLDRSPSLRYRGCSEPMADDDRP